MGACSYCQERVFNDAHGYSSECYSWEEAIACSEKARSRRRKLEEDGLRPRMLTAKKCSEND